VENISINSLEVNIDGDNDLKEGDIYFIQGQLLIAMDCRIYASSGHPQLGTTSQGQEFFSL
jgi:hypothetical protein